MKNNIVFSFAALLIATSCGLWKLSNKVGELSQKVNELSQKVNELSKTNEKLAAERLELVSENASLVSTLADHNATIRGLTAQVATATTAVHTATVATATTSEALAKAEAEIKLLKKLLARANHRVQVAENKVNRLEAEKDSVAAQNVSRGVSVSTSSTSTATTAARAFLEKAATSTTPMDISDETVKAVFSEVDQGIAAFKPPKTATREKAANLRPGESRTEIEFVDESVERRVHFTPETYKRIAEKDAEFAKTATAQNLADLFTDGKSAPITADLEKRFRCIGNGAARIPLSMKNQPGVHCHFLYTPTPFASP